MLNRRVIEAAVIEAARLSGHELNGQEKLVVRTRVGGVLAAKERHRQRMNAGEFKWQKPKPPR
ncbi:TPA: hypothetical protein ACHSMM_003636 [Yersinia enterocolitica]